VKRTRAGLAPPNMTGFILRLVAVGIGTIAAVLICWRLFPALVRVDRFHPAEAVTKPA